MSLMELRNAKALVHGCCVRSRAGTTQQRASWHIRVQNSSALVDLSHTALFRAPICIHIGEPRTRTRRYGYPGR